MMVEDCMIEGPTSGTIQIFHFSSKEPDAIFVFQFDSVEYQLPVNGNRLLLTSYLTLIFIVGISLRGIILTFLTTVESKSRPINVLQWMDQTNAFIGTTLIVSFLLAAANSSGPIGEQLGDDFCKWIHFSSGKLSCHQVDLLLEWR